MMQPVRTSCRSFGNEQVCPQNTRGLLHAIVAKPFFISTAHDPWRAMGHVPALEPTSEVGCTMGLRDVCQRWSPPR
jgi:hypothetical protein